MWMQLTAEQKKSYENKADEMKKASLHAALVKAETHGRDVMMEGAALKAKRDAEVARGFHGDLVEMEKEIAEWMVRAQAAMDHHNELKRILGVG